MPAWPVLTSGGGQAEQRNEEMERALRVELDKGAAAAYSCNPDGESLLQL